MNLNDMKKEKHLKKYIVDVTWYPMYVPIYNDTFIVWCYNKKDIIHLLTEYYNSKMLVTDYNFVAHYKLFSTIWCRLFKKVPDSPTIEHL